MRHENKFNPLYCVVLCVCVQVVGLSVGGCAIWILFDSENLLNSLPSGNTHTHSRLDVDCELEHRQVF